MRFLNGIALSLAATGLLAQAPSDQPGSWMQVQAGLLAQNRSPCITQSEGGGLGGGQWRGPALGWEVCAMEGWLRDAAGLWQADEWHLDGTALWDPFKREGPWKPFLGAGMGISRLEAPLTLTANASFRLNLAARVGGQYYFGPHGLATVEVRALSIRSSTQRTEIQSLLGFGWHWGGERPGPAANKQM